MYLIQLNHLEGVEIILKALRERSQERGCLASHDLAEGIEKTLVYIDETTGVAQLASTLVPVSESSQEPTEPVTKSRLSVVK
jgi:hypothetical protein